jgi:hypothetical protein
VRYGGGVLWSADIGGADTAGVTYSVAVEVTAGDSLYFVLGARGDTAFDSTAWLMVNQYGAAVYVGGSENAARVDGLIAALPSPANIALTDGVALNAVLASYEALSAADKDWVIGYGALIGRFAALEQLRADTVAVAAVKGYVNGLPSVDKITLNDAVYIAFVRTVYDALTPSQKNLVDCTGLTAAETQLIFLADETAARLVILKVGYLPAPDSLKLSDTAAVTAAREAYENLTEPQRALIPSAVPEKLAAAEARIILFADKEVADAVAAQITALPTLITPSATEAISAAREAFDALTDGQKTLVGSQNILKLTFAENGLKDYKPYTPAEPAPEDNGAVLRWVAGAGFVFAAVLFAVVTVIVRKSKVKAKRKKENG